VDSATDRIEGRRVGQGLLGPGNVVIVEPPKPPRDRGNWTCQDVAGSPACTQAAASDVARAIYQGYVDGYDLNPITAGDVMEAFAADIQWASDILAQAPTRAEAFQALQEQCFAGESPLLRFFKAGEEFDHPDVRRDVAQVRSALVGRQGDVCDALPGFYDNVLTQLGNTLDQRVRKRRCNMPTWEVHWSG
jgi:hypothetical protein